MKSEKPFIERNIAITVPIAFTKSAVDAERRTVRGIMTQQIVDAHGEEVDFESVKSCLASWRGNIREMHQPKAVGKALDIVVLDDIKAVELESYISRGAEDTWQKCLDGTLSFYSIGGVADRVVGSRSDGTNGPRLIMRKLNEVSVVDSGACPTAVISVVKLVDDVPTSQLDGDNVVERSEGSDNASCSTVEPTQPNISGVTLLSLTHGVLKGSGFRSEGWNLQQAATTLMLLEDLIASEAFEGDFESAPDNAAQIEMLRFAAQIVIDFIASEFDQQFADGADVSMLSDAERDVVKSVIEKRGARHSRKDSTMLQNMHDTSVMLGASCGVEKMDDTPTPETPVAEALVETPVTESVVEPTPAVEPVTEPIVEKSDDAVTPEPTADAVVAEKSEQTIVEQRVPDVAALVAEEVTKAVTAALQPLAAQLAEQKATSESTIAKLQERIEQLSNEPAPGGPVANAHAAIVEKGTGVNVAELLADKDVAEQVIAKLEEAATEEADPSARRRLVEKALALRMQHGIGSVIVPSVAAR